MKNIIPLILILASVCVKARSVRSLKDFQIGDTFTMRITAPVADNSLCNSVWDWEESQKIDIDFTVLDVGEDSIKIVINPVRWFIYYQCPHNKNLSVYMDTDYFIRYDGKSLFDSFDDNSATASISLKNGDIQFNLRPLDIETSSKINQKEWVIEVLDIPKGLQLISFNRTFPDYDLNFEKLIRLSLGNFVKHLVSSTYLESSLKWLMDLRIDMKNESNSPAFLQIIKASFDLLPNTKIVFTPPIEMHQSKVFIKIDDEIIKPVKELDGSYRFDFFLSSPKRLNIQDIILDLTPEDSLEVKYDMATKKYVFSGKGAANSAYANTQLKLYQTDNKSLSFDEIKKAYHSNLAVYSNQMNNYWLKSAKLSYDYWYASEKLGLYNDDKRFNRRNELLSEDKLPWQSLRFNQIFPFADYLYQPYTYEDFIEAFFDYKGYQANNSVLTGLHSFKGSVAGFYFADAVFSCYPRSYLTSSRLHYLMTSFHLNDYNREYEAFLKRKHNPEIRESVVRLYNQLMKIEPGANIKDLGLEIEKYIPLKQKADGYIILLVEDSIGEGPYKIQGRSVYEDIEQKINEAALKKKVTLCFIMNEIHRPTLDSAPELQNRITFVPEELIVDYENKVVCDKHRFLILRNDGVIINRENSRGSYTMYFIIDAITKDINIYNNQGSNTNNVLVIIVTIIISILFTFFIVRYFVIRQEKIKRHIQGLELKAIRAQMNPHFIFNALGSIQNLISQKKDIEANQYLIKFAKLLRMVLSTSEKRLVSLSEEMEQIDLYLRLETLRVPFEYAINIDKAINVENEEIPGMLIQPIVENAVKHGIVSQGGGTIMINVTKENKAIRIDIIDSGNGFVMSDIGNTEGFGLKSVRERLLLINRENHLNMDIKIDNIITERKIRGAKVSIFIPV